MRGTRFLWLAAGRPAPLETDGTPIHVRVRPNGAVCASCGEAPDYRLSDAISDNFTTVKNASRAWAFGGDSVCAACLWACKTIALRCGLFFARIPDEKAGGGIWFVPMRPVPGWEPLPAFVPGEGGRSAVAPYACGGCVITTRPDPLAALLDPPEPPFVAGLPLYGIDHGGEANADRTMIGGLPEARTWSWARAMVAGISTTLFPYAPGADAKAKTKAIARACATRSAPWAPNEVQPQWLSFLEYANRYASTPWWRVACDPLIKLQSKHTALYCRVSGSRERYHLQVDDASDVVVDTTVWRAMRAACEPLLAEMRAGGVGATDARAAILTLRQPPCAPLPLLASWRRRVDPMRPFAGASWWRLFTDLLPMPALTPTPKGPAVQ